MAFVVDACGVVVFEVGLVNVCGLRGWFGLVLFAV